MDSINNSISQIEYDENGNIKELRSEHFEASKFNYEDTDDVKDLSGRIDIGSSFSSFVTSLSLADARKTERTYAYAEESFIDVLRNCKTEEDVKNVRDALQSMADIGGYAYEFNKKHAHILTSIESVKKYLQENKYEVYKPVSKIKYDDKGNIKELESEYISAPKLEFNKTKDIDEFSRQIELSSTYNSFINTLAIADVKRTEQNYTQAREDFKKVLKKCQSEDDVKVIKDSLQSMEDIGGYAAIFNIENKTVLNDMNTVKNYLNDEPVIEQKQPEITKNEEISNETKETIPVLEKNDITEVKEQENKNETISNETTPKEIIPVQENTNTISPVYEDKTVSFGSTPTQQTEVQENNNNNLKYEARTVSYGSTPQQVTETQENKTEEIKTSSNNKKDELEEMMKEVAAIKTKQKPIQQENTQQKQINQTNSNLPDKVTEITYDEYGNFKQMKSDYLSIPKFKYENKPENEDEEIRRSNYEEKFNSFVSEMCIADARRNEQSFTELKDRFLKVLRRCYKEEDLKNLKESMQNLSNIGGYATTFLEENKKIINNWNELRKYIEDNKKRKYPPVTTIDPETDKIKSKYDDIYTNNTLLKIVKGSNHEKDKEFMLYLGMIRSSFAFEDINKKGVKAYNMIRTTSERYNSTEELTVIARLIKLLASYGGYARDFYENIEEELAHLKPSILNSLIEKVKDPNILNTIQNDKQPIKRPAQEETTNIDYLRRELSTNIEKLSMELEGCYNRGNLKEYEIAGYLKKCNSFKELLDKNKDSLGISFYEEYNEQIDRMKTSLNGSLEMMEEESKIWSRAY